MEKKIKNYRFQVNTERDKDVVDILEKIPRYFRSQYIMDALRAFEPKKLFFNSTDQNKNDRNYKNYIHNGQNEQEVKINLDSQEGNNQIYDKEKIIETKEEAPKNKPLGELDLTKIFD